MCLKVVAFIASLLACSLMVQGEVFTAVVHMEELVNLERELLQSLNTYITLERKRLDQLDRFADKVKHAQDKSGNDPARHLHHPVNAFQLLNRYVNGWMKIEDSIYQDNGKDLMANVSLKKNRFPTSEDYKGAAVAIMRLQDTYNLTTAAIARGHDCFLIGEEADLNKKWKHTRRWMVEALGQFDEERDMGQLDINLVYDHLAFAEYKLKNVKNAIYYTKLLQQNDPSNPDHHSNLEYFSSLLQSDPKKWDVPQDNMAKSSQNHNLEQYYQLCREPDPLPKGLHHKLICYYDDKNHNPRLLLSPLKVEVLHVDPDLFLLRELLTEEEMNRLKELASPELQRAIVSHNGNPMHSNYRISKSAWLYPSDDSLGYVAHINQHIEDATGLDMETAEPLQVVNYGIGGEFNPHYDFLTMSNVELGGATVFPMIRTRVSPSKGDAALWFNLKRSGKEDFQTLHAGCPVLVGSKWICNKWIHERGQEFKFPCSLKSDE